MPTPLTTADQDDASVIITFRVHERDHKRLLAAFSNVPGSCSRHQLARKAMLDLLDGNAVYISRQARLASR